MSRLFSNGRPWAFAALATLLLGAQALVLHHELEHDGDHADEHCAVCTIGITNQHAVAVAEHSIPWRPVDTPTTQAPLRVFIAPDVPTPEARAPPVHS